MQNELHFYESERVAPYNVYTCFTETAQALEEAETPGLHVIHTTQMALLEDGTRYLAKNWRIFIHDSDNLVYELRLGKCDRTDKEIRVAHNLYKIWRANGFARKTTKPERVKPMVIYVVTETNVDGCGSNATEHICFFKDTPLTAAEYAVFQTCLNKARALGNEQLWDTGERIEYAMKSFTQQTNIECQFHNPHCDGTFTF